MTRISSVRGLRGAYDDLLFAESLLKEFAEKVDTIEPLENRIKDIKRDIRRYNKDNSKDRRIIHEDGIDGYTVLIDCPEFVTDEETARKWFEDNEYRECIPSAYDCTGQAFTIWHKFVERRGRWYCYHTVGFDV